MTKKFTVREELETLQGEFELLNKISCSEEDNKKYEDLISQGKALPDGVYRVGTSTETFYELYKADDLSSDERKEFVFLKAFNVLRADFLRNISVNMRKQKELLDSIRNMLQFFVILTVIEIISAIILIIMAFSS